MNKLRQPQVIMMLLAILFLAVTFAYPKISLQQATYRYVYVFDISQSMNVLDAHDKEPPISRLNFAKQAAIDSLSQLPCGTELGIALFTGHRVLLLTTPVETCQNQHDLSNTINMIDWTSTWEAKSEVAKGIYKSIRLMKRIDKDIDMNTRVIFFTDGHEAPPVNPDVLPVFSGKIGQVKGVIVGVGGKKRVKIPKIDRATGKQVGYWTSADVVHIDVYTQEKNKREGVKPLRGTEHLSSLREPYLKDIAKKTGLKYHRLLDLGAFSKEVKSKSLSNPNFIQTDIRWLLALLALFLFIANYLIGLLRKRLMP